MFAVLGHLGPLEVPSRFIHGYTEDLLSLSLAVFAARSLTNPNHIFIYFLRREVSKKKAVRTGPVSVLFHLVVSLMGLVKR